LCPEASSRGALGRSVGRSVGWDVGRDLAVERVAKMLRGCQPIVPRLQQSQHLPPSAMSARCLPHVSREQIYPPSNFPVSPAHAHAPGVARLSPWDTSLSLSPEPATVPTRAGLRFGPCMRLQQPQHLPPPRTRQPRPFPRKACLARARGFSIPRLGCIHPVVARTRASTNPHGKTKPSIFRPQIYLPDPRNAQVRKGEMAPKTDRFGLSVRVGGCIKGHSRMGRARFDP
jgi:hypothetical protein